MSGILKIIIISGTVAIIFFELITKVWILYARFIISKKYMDGRPTDLILKYLNF